jgi:hypothetical protein
VPAVARMSPQKPCATPVEPNEYVSPATLVTLNS